jgi:hypothetical protein
VNLIENIWVEISLLLFAFVVGFYSLWHGYRKHHHRVVTLIIFSIGITLFVVHQFVEVPYYGFTLILPGVVAVLTAHYLNYQLCRKANHCHASDCNHE